jgi:phosphopantothenate-cysteine ligase
MADELQQLERVSTTEIAELDYFTVHEPPRSMMAISQQTSSFVDYHSEQNHRVVLVTSGGTTVPLENQTVRFIDNFSAGTRGATSAEYFLKEGYAVIFLHRQFSLLPFSRHYSHTSNCFLDFMTEDSNGAVVVEQQYQTKMQHVLQSYQTAKRDNMLLLLPFTTVTDYLWSLREIAGLMKPLGPQALFYLAAAVSDFFVPKDRLTEHKIQSSDPKDNELDVEPRANGQVSSSKGKKLVIDLDPVPKFLKRLVDGWAPDAMIVSFKLETDPALLISKAQTALERYSHHLVIGNLLATRSYEVVFVVPGMQDKWIRIPHHKRVKSMSSTAVDLKKVREALASANLKTPTGDDQDEPIEIESIIVPEVVKMHDKHIADSKV